ncbi:MAG: B3/4 domain-containing protein [Erysipelotrichaceae bacterium]|nr:B3/4 domain-containing protein [Erysipelotrichaceae bacterium]
MRFTHGDEIFIPLGQSEPVPVQANEYSYIDDDNEVICRLEIRQVNKTKVTEDSKNIFFIVQGNEKTSNDYILDVANELINLITKYAGGTGKILNTL